MRSKPIHWRQLLKRCTRRMPPFKTSPRSASYWRTAHPDSAKRSSHQVRSSEESQDECLSLSHEVDEAEEHLLSPRFEWAEIAGNPLLGSRILPNHNSP